MKQKLNSSISKDKAIKSYSYKTFSKFLNKSEIEAISDGKINISRDLEENDMMGRQNNINNNLYFEQNSIYNPYNNKDFFINDRLESINSKEDLFEKISVNISISANESQKLEKAKKAKFSISKSIENFEQFQIFKYSEYDEITKKNFEHICQINENSEHFQNNFINKKRELSFKEEKMNKNENKKPRSTHDYLIKSFLSNFINTFLFKKLNILSKKCGLGKIYKSNYKINIKPNETRLLSLIQKTVKDIFTNYKINENKEYKNQKKNYNLVEILDSKMYLSKEEEELKQCFDSTLEEQLKLYYESEDLEKFKNKKLKHGTPLDYNKIFYKERNRHYYLLEPYGFIRYAKSKPYCHNERKKK